VQVTEISLGGAGYGAVEEGQIYGGVTDEQAVGCINEAIGHGINFFDVAPLYAEGELRLG
jgi:aryl-alcohol dehydrogenase-like predicted oxidoreductase